MATRLTFGEPASDDDTLVIQGTEYPMQPIGMRAMRRLLNARAATPVAEDGSDKEAVAAQRIDAAIELVVAAVRADHRDALREHIEDRVPAPLLVRIADAIVSEQSDLDPTQPQPSSDGSSPTGPASMDGAPAAASTPTS